MYRASDERRVWMLFGSSEAGLLGFLWRFRYTCTLANRLGGETQPGLPKTLQHSFLEGMGQDPSGMREAYDLLSDLGEL